MTAFNRPILSWLTRINRIGGKEALDLILQGKAVETVSLNRPATAIPDMIEMTGLRSINDAVSFILICALEKLADAMQRGKDRSFISKDEVKSKHDALDNPPFTYRRIQNVFAPSGQEALLQLASQVQNYGYDVEFSNGGLVAKMRTGWTNPV